MADTLALVIIAIIIISLIHYKVPFDTKIEVIDDILEALDRLWDFIFQVKGEVEPPIGPPQIISNFTVQVRQGSA